VPEIAGESVPPSLSVAETPDAVIEHESDRLDGFFGGGGGGGGGGCGGGGG